MTIDDCVVFAANRISSIQVDLNTGGRMLAKTQIWDTGISEEISCHPTETGHELALGLAVTTDCSRSVVV